jgi:hypothetical protein
VADTVGALCLTALCTEICPRKSVKLSTVFTKSFPQINLTPVTAKEIKNIINSLKWKNSSGYDEIPPRILKI